MKKLTTLALAALVAMPLGAAAQVSVPALIPIQGFLTDPKGAPLDGDYVITVTLYDDEFGTTVVAIDTQTVAVSSGYFTFSLGASSALDLQAFASGAQLHVGITIESDPEMTPLLPLGTVPFAAAAQNAASADTLEGYSAQDFMLKADGEADPVFAASPVGAVTADDLANWDEAYNWGDHAGAGYLTSEADPAFNASAAASISSDQISQWDEAYTWGDHAGAGYLTSEADPAFTASPASGISSGQIGQWDQAYNWGDHASAGYLTSETDPAFTASAASGISSSQINQWDQAYNWGNHASAGYLTSEADPAFTASAASGISSGQIGQWDQAYTWGNHASAGYLTSEADPAFTASPASGISSGQIGQWDQAYTWGNHASAGYLTNESDPAFTASAASGISSGQIGQWNQAYNWGNHASAGYLTNESDPAFTGSPAAGITQSDITNWNAAAAEGPQPWTIADNDLYYNEGKVGVGTANPEGSLEVYTLNGGVIRDTHFTVTQPNAVCGRSNGYCYQSFTVENTGVLTELKVLVCIGGPNGGTLSLFEGDCATSKSCDGTTGFVQNSQMGTGGCNLNSGWGTYKFNPPVPVTAGQSYTFRVNNITAYENNNGGYAGGAAYEDANPHLDGDVPFEAHVQRVSRVALSDFIYFGHPSKNGAFRMGAPANNFLIQRRVNGNWVTLQSW